jgi:hypothetical protein
MSEQTGTPTTYEGNPTITVVGDALELTKGGGTGFSDDGAGYKNEGGSRRPEPYDDLPAR